MFSSFTSYLFGYSTDEEPTPAEQVASDEIPQTENTEHVLKTISESSDDEWELIEKEPRLVIIGDVCSVDYNSLKCSNTSSEKYSQHLPLNNELLTANLNYHDNHFERYDTPFSSNFNPLPSVMHSSMSDTSSDVSTLPEMACSGESWLVTPPPCFTACDGARIDISHMENLLIEHPSMSVYGPRHRLNSEGSVSRSSESSEEAVRDSEEITNLSRNDRNLKVNHPPPRRVHAIAARIGLAKQLTKNQRKAQVIQRQDLSCSISRSSMRRSNKIVHKSKQHKQIHPRIVYQPSRCSVRS